MTYLRLLLGRLAENNTTHFCHHIKTGPNRRRVYQQHAIHQTSPSPTPMETSSPTKCIPFCRRVETGSPQNLICGAKKNRKVCLKKSVVQPEGLSIRRMPSIDPNYTSKKLSTELKVIKFKVRKVKTSIT